MLSDLNMLPAFIATARLRSFRAAAASLGVTPSAVSQTIKRLEHELGIALLQRTTRSVALTEAGQEFLARLTPALEEVQASVDATGTFADRPRGDLRITVSSIAERFLTSRLLTDFAEAYPEIRTYVLVTDDEFDIVAEGFDAGVRLGEVIEKDMVAVPVSGPQRQLAVCAPDYLQKHGTPAHPRDLIAHRTVGWRPSPQHSPYRWEFAENGAEFNVAVTPIITTSDMGLMIRLAAQGTGVTFGMEETFRPWIARGDLVPVLTAFCPTFPGFYLYFPSRQNLAPKLRIFIDHAKAWHASQAR
jgi:DNA-binding transcriptional LysR family regulator